MYVLKVRVKDEIREIRYEGFADALTQLWDYKLSMGLEMVTDTEFISKDRKYGFWIEEEED